MKIVTRWKLIEICGATFQSIHDLFQLSDSEKLTNKKHIQSFPIESDSNGKSQGGGFATGVFRDFVITNEPRNRNQSICHSATKISNHFAQVSVPKTTSKVPSTTARLPPTTNLFTIFIQQLVSFGSYGANRSEKWFRWFYLVMLLYSFKRNLIT